MDTGTASQIAAATVPALVSTGITLLYLLLKLLNYITYATPRKTQRQEGQGCDHQKGQPQQSTGTGRESGSEVPQPQQGSVYERQYGQRWCPTPRPIFLPRTGENVLLHPKSNAIWDNDLPALSTDGEGLRK